jgi:hypothetical protein
MRDERTDGGTHAIETPSSVASLSVLCHSHDSAAQSADSGLDKDEQDGSQTYGHSIDHSFVLHST